MLSRCSRCEALDSRTLLSAGDPDPSFYTNGLLGLSGFSAADVALQSDGKVVLAGSRNNHLAAARLNVDGTLDTSFGIGSTHLFESSFDALAGDVAIQADDRILITFGGQMGVARLLADGSSLDFTFGSGGIASISGTRLQPRNLAVQQDGKVVVVGGDRSNSADEDFIIVRYTANGLPDSTFSGDGIVTAGFGQSESALAVAIDYNGTPSTNPLYGTIVAVGDKRPQVLGPSARISICRLLPNGNFDNSFDGDGKLTSPDLSPQDGEEATGVMIQSGGRIVVSGTELAIAGTSEIGDFIVARYLSNGALDTTFGGLGTGVLQSDFGGDELAVELAPSYLGGFLVSGWGGGSTWALAAYTPDGLLDLRFSGDGFFKDSLFSFVPHIATTLSTIAPPRRVIVAFGNHAFRYVDVGPIITLGAGRTEVNEPPGAPLNVFVARPDRPPTVQRVYINIGGTAHKPFFGLPSTWDYDMDGINASAFTTPYVDIPAGEAFTTFSITPIDDTRAEGDETIEFSLIPDDTYEIGNPSSTTLVIRDDDLTGGPAVTSAAFIYDSGAPQRVAFTFNQNVASSIADEDFQITGPPGMPGHSFAYNANTNTATLSFAAVLLDGNYSVRAVAAGISNSGGQPMASDALLNFFWLNGDANHDHSVDTLDFNALAANFGGTGKTFSQADFNYDAAVDTLDFNVLAAQFGKTLPTSASPASPTAMRLRSISSSPAAPESSTLSLPTDPPIQRT